MPALAAMGPGLQTDFARIEARLATRGAATAEHQPLDEETRRRLRALGYAN
jgi:hypothetical protein